MTGLRPSAATAAAVADDAESGLRDRTGFWLYALHLLTVFGLAASNAFLGLSVLWSGVGLRAARVRARWSWQRLRPVMAPLVLYVLVLCASVATSQVPELSARALTEVIALAPFVIAPLWLHREEDVRRLVGLLIVLVAALAAIGIGQYYLTEAGTIHDRIRGPFSHYMTFAGALLIGDLLLLARLLTPGGWRRWWRWAGLAVINLALFLSLTRSAWVGLSVALVLYFLLRSRHLPRLLVPTAAVALLILAFGPHGGIERVRSIGDVYDASNYDRLCMARAGLDMIAERPLFGLGPGVVEARYPIYRHPTGPRLGVPHLHNSFLELAAERGLLGLGTYLALMAGGLVVAARAYRREGGTAGPRADLLLGVILVLVAFNVSGLFEDNWGDSELQRLVLFVLVLPFCLPPLRAAGDGAAAEAASERRLATPIAAAGAAR